MLFIKLYRLARFKLLEYNNIKVNFKLKTDTMRWPRSFKVFIIVSINL